MSFTLIPQGACASHLSGRACAICGVLVHSTENVRSHYRSPMTQNAGDLIHDLKKLLLRAAIIVSASKSSNRSSQCNSWISHTSHEMTVSAVERHGAGIKGMDQLSTVTTRTQLQRIHIRSQSLRVMLSPPPLRFHKHAYRKRERKYTDGTHTYEV